MAWQLQDAKSRFSEVVQRAIAEGPQTVTLRGRRAVVIVAAETYDRLSGEGPSLVDTLLEGPAWDDATADAVSRRAKRPSRGPVD